MQLNQRNANTEESRFRLVKFFAYTSLIVLIIFSFPFSVVTSQNAKDILMMSYENYAIMLGDNLSHQVFQNFVIPVASRFGKISLRQEEQQKWLDQIVRNTIHSFKIDEVNIYDIEQGLVAYSTDPKQIEKKVTENIGYKKAVKGEHSSGLISGGGYLWAFGIERLGAAKKLKTYIPFRGMDPFTGRKGDVLGVFEITQDLTEEYQSVIKLQYLIFGLSTLIMGLIFVALLLIVRKAERIIEQRTKEQMSLEAQLNQSERLAALGQMIAGVSHEIRNPLGIIRSTAELLGDLPGSDANQKKLSGLIIEASSRLNNIVTEFLDFARPQRPDIQECYLDEIIAKNLEFLQPELDKHGISVNNTISGRSIRLEADPHLLYRAFLNIFINAVQSMNGGGTISIRLDDDRHYYFLSIEDMGCGISNETMSKVFNPFYSTKDKGSGLGLPIVRNIVEAHNGAISLESEQGAGTKVIIKLPKER
ncbi:ATPase/histidine kinase/DNA gyrase B/HSP90 domain protein [uncultured Desulfobacterium sp.]|uniref:histidine kinase n=1 Tax=uncultured Desulfobacterium sp. TaxID=201089 RepID=A0A445N208_9BACT|nr:ATPase/histidine kinase/DNA gyrase B/HSP90 domain protein [uncultured Desulfobacterium sp.]